MSRVGLLPITADEVRRLNTVAIEQSGGELGVLNQSNIENCCDLITNVFYGIEQHIGLLRKAAALMECISLGHAFLDGNKRTALLAVDEFLFRNGWIFIPDNKTIDISIRTARGEVSIDKLEAWIQSCSKPTL